MRFRILVFLILQIAAWTLYFNTGKVDNTRSQRQFQVKEIKGEEKSIKINGIESYSLLLRNDGLFTKLVDNRIVESGLWSVNFDIPSLILKSPAREYKFKIVKYNGADLEIMLMNHHEIRDVAELGNKKSMDRLFSSVKN
jgi:hypothetical protein